jgi:hypothetical protein
MAFMEREITGRRGKTEEKGIYQKRRTYGTATLLPLPSSPPHPNLSASSQES